MAERILPLAYDEFTVGDETRDYTDLGNAWYYNCGGDMVAAEKGAVITVYKDAPVYNYEMSMTGYTSVTNESYFPVIRGVSPALENMPVWFLDDSFNTLWLRESPNARVYDLAVIGVNENDAYNLNQTFFLIEDGATAVGLYISVQDYRENANVTQMTPYVGESTFIACVAYDLQLTQAGAYIFCFSQNDGTANLKNCTFRNQNSPLNSVGVLGTDIGTNVINATNLLLQNNALDFYEATGYGGSLVINKAGNKTTGASFGGLGFNTLFDLTGGVAGTVSEDFFGNVVPPGSDFVGATYTGTEPPEPGGADGARFIKKQFEPVRFCKIEFKQRNFKE